MDEKEQSLKEKVRKLPTSSGVYVMKDKLGSVIYIGKAKNLRQRVRSYFMPSYRNRVNPKIVSLTKCIADLEFHTTRDEQSALVLESQLIKKWKPRYNTLEKDNKNFLLLRVEMFRPLPRFTFDRNKREDNSLYFGPYLDTKALRSALQEIKKNFGILLSDAKPKQNDDGLWILYDDARSEISKFPNVVSKEEYAERVEKALDYLRGKDKERIEELRKKMLEASAEEKFELAGKFRDLIFAIEETRKGNARANQDVDISRTSPRIAMLALDSLKKTLQMEKEPRSIECFDISHISGSFCVASCVHFDDGEPAKNKYVHFKIKSFIGNDDYRAMEEVVGRRYRRLVDEGKPLPDLILIDGGKGQVFSAMKAFDSAGIKPPTLAGLAEKEEIIITENFEEKKLSRRHEGLKLLQRVRDEAHRFANSFNASLRSKKIRESILDDISGLGEKRKNALLKYFGSIAKIKSATIEELRKVEGVGFETACVIRDFLDANFPPEK
ncbi:MAG: excinuclease ABC subunit UvrC [Opitutales bacterium]|nr:excinuclease ABC subunit UvrC [Opitutales bacterium]MBP3358592.1 excinuclease ABC subunit UvrC [Opitutales bacterium]